MISKEEKNIFLQDLEEEMNEENLKNKKNNDDEWDDEFEDSDEFEDDDEYETDDEDEDEDEKDDKKVKKKKKKKKKKKSHTVALFAAGFIFFLFIIILLIFMLSLAESGNPIFQAFGIEPYEIKSFLKGLVNKIFMGVVVILLLLLAVGLFRGYSLPKEKKEKRRGSFIFGGVSGGLIFLSIIAWGGAIAFIDKFATEGIGRATIQILDLKKGKEIIAPIDIEFSAKDIATQFKRQGKIIIGYRWSKDGGKKFSSTRLDPNYTFQFFQKGIQTINLEVELRSGEIVEYERAFTVDDATFLMSPSKALQNKKVQFDASMIFKGNAEYFWDFDNDGVFEKKTRSKKVSTSFEKKGEHTVNLRIESDSDGIEKYSRTFIVSSDSQKNLDANISANKELKGKSPYEITFDANDSYSEYGEIKKYNWKIGSSVQKQGAIISHVFTKEGNIPVILTIIGENNETDQEKIIVQIEKGNSPPNAVIKTKPPFNNSSKKLEGLLPLEVNFYGGKSTDADENIVQYKWIITDKNDDEEEFYGDEMQKIFRKEGVYKVTLQVFDQEGEKDEYIIEINVKEPPVVPIIKAFPESGTSPLIVEFNASQSTCKLKNCKILSYEWDFDDGKKPIQSGAFISHQFIKPGTYEVKTTAITNLGERASVISYISVTDKPFVACFRPSRTSGPAPLTVSFNPNTCSKGDIVKYQWDFGDGFISGKRNPTHIYNQEGEYTAILHTFDKEGRVSEMKEIITVTPKLQ